MLPTTSDELSNNMILSILENIDTSSMYSRSLSEFINYLKYSSPISPMNIEHTLTSLTTPQEQPQPQPQPQPPSSFISTTTSHRPPQPPSSFMPTISHPPTEPPSSFIPTTSYPVAARRPYRYMPYTTRVRQQTYPQYPPQPPLSRPYNPQSHMDQISQQTYSRYEYLHPAQQPSSFTPITNYPPPPAHLPSYMPQQFNMDQAPPQPYPAFHPYPPQPPSSFMPSIRTNTYPTVQQHATPTTPVHVNYNVNVSMIYVINENSEYDDMLDQEEEEEVILNVGLSEETISNNLKTSLVTACEVNAEGEVCTVCLDEYKVDETIGTLECGHRYHADCIKGWLLHKNVCPICKATALVI